MAGSLFDQKQNLLGQGINQRKPSKPGFMGGLRKFTPNFDRSNGRHWLYLGAGLLTVWSGFSYDSVPVLPQPIPVTPSRALANFITLPDRLFDNKDYKGHSSAPSSAAEPTSTSVLASNTSLPTETTNQLKTSNTLPAFGGALPAAPPIETTILITPPEITPASQEPMVAFTSGDIACSFTTAATFGLNQKGKVVAPVTAMASASGQPINKLLPNVADQFWYDTQSKLNAGVDLSNPIEGTLFTGPAGCTIPAGDLLP